MTIEEMKREKAALGISNEELSGLSGVPVSTIQKVLSGTTASPRMSTIVALEEGLRIADRNRQIYSSLHDIGSPYMVKEEIREADFPELSAQSRTDLRFAPVGSERMSTGHPEPPLPSVGGSEAAVDYCPKRQGEYTLDDYYAIPDERRVELIDGVIYDMGAPTYRHQAILGELYLQFRACTDKHEGSCRVVLSPCDVQLDNDNRTMVQPDLFVMCRNYDINMKHFKGAPDLAVEILSPSTRSKDMLLKSYKYEKAGVREYWIVDPFEEEVIVYDFTDKDMKLTKYSFSDTIPICISEGKCSIDFSKISKALK